jgi:Protein of unknown function (DUF3422)
MVEPTANEYELHSRQVHPAMPPRLALPALNFHRAWWFPAEDRDSANTKQRLRDRIAALLTRGNTTDEALSIVNINGDKIGAWPFDPARFRFMGLSLATTSDLAEPNLLDVDNFALWLLRDGMLVRLQVAVHSEYFTVTLWSLFTRLKHTSGRTVSAAKTASCDDLGRMWVPVLAAAGKRLPADFAPASNTAEDVKASAKQLYDTHHSRLFTDLLGEESGIFDLDRLFADFRSIIVPSALQLDGEPHTQPNKIADPARILNAMASLFSQFNDRAPELMGSLFLDERVAYVSSLGSHYVQPGEQVASVKPVRYMMYADGVSRWQTGRLIERLNTMGTYRLAAQRDLSGLNRVSDRLQSIGRVLDGIDLINGSFESSTFQAQYQAFNKAAVESESRTLAHNGVSFRVERSRFYVQLFQSLVRDLRSTRVPGYQSYPDFVRRRYGPTWDRIDRIGVRYERLAKRLDYLSNFAQIEQLRHAAEAQKALSQEQGAQTEALNKAAQAQVDLLKEQGNQTKALRASAKAQVSLLRGAEIVSVIPLSYYGKVPASQILYALQLGYLKPAAFFVNVMIFCIVMILISLFAKHDTDPPNQRHDSLLWWWILVPAFFTVFIVCETAPPPEKKLKPPPSAPAALSVPSLPSAS